MTKKQSLSFRFLLFLAGAGIVVLAFFLIRGGKELDRIGAFTWISIGLMYIFFFLPSFFSSINVGNFSGRIPSFTMVWLGIFFYIAAGILVILLLAVFRIISFNAAVIIQSILLFFFAVNIYLAYFASSHVRDVALEEAGKQQYINQLKPKAQSLRLSVNKLPAQYESEQTKLKSIIDDIRYIYPVDGGAGNDLELQILQSLNKLSEICGNTGAEAQSSLLAAEAENLGTLVKERKLLRN